MPGVEFYILGLSPQFISVEGVVGRRHGLCHEGSRQRPQDV
jgi:hypothetical protein